MICPHCGAQLARVMPSCELCGREIDIRGTYEAFVKKGDEALSFGEHDKAILNYKKALEFTAGNEDIYLKLGNAMNAKGDKQAAGMFFKALNYNFYSERAHDLLIALYTKHRKLEDLKAWYKKSAETADPEFIEKKIKIIDYTTKFSNEQLYAAPDALPGEGLGATLIKSIKQYMIMNTVIGILLLLVGGGIAAGYFLGMNTKFIVIFSGLFFMSTLIMLFFYRMKKIKQSKENLVKPEDILKEFASKDKGGPT